MRGRVGRSQQKASVTFITLPTNVMTNDARKPEFKALSNLQMARL